MTTTRVMVGTADFTGQRVNTLHIGAMVSRHPSPRYMTTCERCGARGTAGQHDISTGAARCRAASCGREPLEPRATLAQVGYTPTAVRSRDSESARQFQQQQIEKPVRWADQPSEVGLQNADPDSLRRFLDYQEEHAGTR